METITGLKEEQKKTNEEIEGIKTARYRFARTGVISEEDLANIDDKLKLRKVILDLLDNLAENKEWIQADIEQSISFYENGM